MKHVFQNELVEQVPNAAQKMKEWQEKEERYQANHGKPGDASSPQPAWQLKQAVPTCSSKFHEAKTQRKLRTKERDRSDMLHSANAGIQPT
jgi:hypothetical protein